MIRWIIGSLINIHQYKTEGCFIWHFLFFQLTTLVIFMGWFFYYEPLLRKRVKKRIKFFDVHVILTLIIYFLKLFLFLLRKSSHTVSWTYYNLYHIYNISPFPIRRKDTWRYVCLKSQMFCILYLFTYYLCIFNIALYIRSSMCSNLKK